MGADRAGNQLEVTLDIDETRVPGDFLNEGGIWRGRGVFITVAIVRSPDTVPFAIRAFAGEDVTFAAGFIQAEIGAGISFEHGQDFKKLGNGVGEPDGFRLVKRAGRASRAKAAEGGPVIAAVFAPEFFDFREFVLAEIRALVKGDLELAGFEHKSEAILLGSQRIERIVLLHEVITVQRFIPEVESQATMGAQGSHDADVAALPGFRMDETDDLGFFNRLPRSELEETVRKIVEWCAWHGKPQGMPFIKEVKVWCRGLSHGEIWIICQCMSFETMNQHAIGVIGGSGLYEMEGIGAIEELAIRTPFGDPSDKVVSGWIDGRRVCFLPRHGVGHRILPHEINHRANIWALRSLGVRWLVSVTAVGSLREEMAPRDIVVPDQLIDRTGTAAKHTFFGKGIAAHVGFADPYCRDLRNLLLETAGFIAAKVHDKGTYLCMNGPAFSTRAEANMHRMMGADVIGMTNGPEARLCREAEIAAAALALVTDYDCWKEDEEPVDVETVLANLLANSTVAKRIVRELIAKIPETPDSAAHRVLDTAVFTPREMWPGQTARDLAPILGRLDSSLLPNG